MKKNIQRIVFSSGISDITEKNTSFDGGVLKIAYTGKNRNGSHISKAAFERSLSTIYNCPVVANYNRETDTIGSHDMEIVKDDSGVHIVNITQPVGIIPESARVWWELDDDENGVEHEYLCADVLLWKRQEAYQKIKRDGIVDESMEINVIAGKLDKRDNIYYIDKFEFTAFCLLGTAEPCYEGASLEVFSKDEFRAQLSEMLSEFKESFSVISAQNGQSDINNSLTEGGEIALQNDVDLEKRVDYADDTAEAGAGEGIDSGDGNSLDDAELEPIGGNGETQEPGTNPSTEPAADPADETPEEETPANDGDDPEDNSDEDPITPGRAPRSTYELISLVIEEAVKALYSLGDVETPWGIDHRYWYWDIDTDVKEVYATDVLDWNIYGFAYTISGDALSVNEESKKRMKLALQPYVDGETAELFNLYTHFNKQYKTLKDTMNASLEELNSLRDYKKSAEKNALIAAQEKVFEKFTELDGIEAFEALKADPGEITAEDLEEKCYALKGRFSASLNYSKEPKTPKLPVLGMKDTAKPNDPYNGVFEQHGYKPIN